MKKRYLVLQNGRVFQGRAFGAEASCVGELVFTTGMTGYIETLTDPSYCGQIVLQTFPLIGNYGMIDEDAEGECALCGYVVREWCDAPSNFRSGGNIDSYLKKRGIPGIYGVDTREITGIIRECGVMNACICDDPEEAEILRELYTYRVENALEKVSTKSVGKYAAENAKRSIALIDYGAKRNIIRELLHRGCNIAVYPHDTPAEVILSSGADGVMLSNGPGDPADYGAEAEVIAKLLGRVPIFGICLGHQLLAIASGGRTVKLKYGHRGANQPARDIRTGRTYITSQNHGYAVDADSVAAAVQSFVNANDGTCEGLEYPGYGAFSVQFHPEACAGPHDTSFLFDRFCRLADGEEDI